MLFDKLFCRHENLRFVRNIHGDEINMAGGKRSEWVCTRCGKTILKDQLCLGEPLTWKDMNSLNSISGVLRSYGHETLADILIAIQCKCTDVMARNDPEHTWHPGCAHCRGTYWTHVPFKVITQRGTERSVVFNYCPYCGKHMKKGD